eukprot:COSAG02_NODE_24051_length_699_cov_1.100000_1_plen_78_part_10
MADPYAQMLGNPNLSEEQRAKVLKMQARRRQRNLDQQQAPDAALSGSMNSMTPGALAGSSIDMVASPALSDSMNSMAT